MEEERKEFCEAAGQFKLAAQTAHANGVRAMAGNFPWGHRSASGTERRAVEFYMI